MLAWSQIPSIKKRLALQVGMYFKHMFKTCKANPLNGDGWGLVLLLVLLLVQLVLAFWLECLVCPFY
jgi:hypothetical protein